MEETKISDSLFLRLLQGTQPKNDKQLAIKAVLYNLVKECEKGYINDGKITDGSEFYRCALKVLGESQSKG